MLPYLDTLIGFALVMSVVSLLITIVTQIVSNLLGLRGKSLADSIEMLVRKIDPGIDAHVRQLANKLADRILTDPAVSDSVLPFAKRNWTLWKRATAIRPIEIIEILERIARTTRLVHRTVLTDDDLAAVPSLITRLAQSRILGETLAAQWSSEARSQLAHVNSAGPISDTLRQSLLDGINRLIAGEKQLLDPQQFPNLQLSEETRQLLALNPSGKDLARLNRLLLEDVIAQEVLAASGPLCPAEAATRLLRLLRTPSPSTVQAMVVLTQELPALARERGIAFIGEFHAAMNVALNNLETAFNSAQDRAKQWFAAHTRAVTIVASILAAFVLQLDAFSLLHRLAASPELRARLLAALPGIEEQAGKILKNDDDPENPTPEKQHEAISELAGSFETIRNDLSKTGINIVPDPYPSASEWFWPFHHLLGLLASAALLSLGAPFWFNLLKSLTSLRPVLADQVDRHPRQPKP